MSGSSQFLEDLLTRFDFGVVVTDSLNRIERVNAAFRSSFGTPNGNHCRDLFHQDGDHCPICTGSSAPGEIIATLWRGPTLTSSTPCEFEVTRACHIAAGGEEQRYVVFRPVAKAAATGSPIKAPVAQVQPDFAELVGTDPKMIELYDTIRELANVEATVLIQGESGTGKELVASAIHSWGPRRDQPFVPVNCAALPESLLESELFGHVRGAFSGAVRDKKGRFELAQGGTLFLDEIGELSPAVQVTLLRVLQERTIEPVGSEHSFKVDVRLVSATNRDLRRLVSEGKFREDLYYRLCVVPVQLAPLRERTNDIPRLASHFLGQVGRESGTSTPAVTDRALDALMAHNWPGNVRELQNALRFATVKARGADLDRVHLPASVRGEELERVAAKRGRKRKLNNTVVEEALKETAGNKARAALMLGVSRTTLYSYLEAR